MAPFTRPCARARARATVHVSCFSLFIDARARARASERANERTNPDIYSFESSENDHPTGEMYRGAGFLQPRTKFIVHKIGRVSTINKSRVEPCVVSTILSSRTIPTFLLSLLYARGCGGQVHSLLDALPRGSL